MASFCWDYRATHGDNLVPKNCSSIHVYLHMKNVSLLATDPEIFVVRVDPDLETMHDDNLGVIGTDWGDVLRLPTDGNLSQDHPYFIATRSVSTTWIGTVAEFPSVYDIMIGASQYNDSSKFAIVRNGELVYAVYHPMCGKLPSKKLLETMHVDDRKRLFSIILEVMWLCKMYKKCGHISDSVTILRNCYSVFSASSSAVVLLISYFGLKISADGTVQDNLDNYAEYRHQIATYMVDLVKSWAFETESKNIGECLERITALFDIAA
jgi:hypothetical protein